MCCYEGLDVCGGKGELWDKKIKRTYLEGLPLEGLLGEYIGWDMSSQGGQEATRSAQFSGQCRDS
jgi:hypothetical protein